VRGGWGRACGVWGSVWVVICCVVSWGVVEGRLVGVGSKGCGCRGGWGR